MQTISSIIGQWTAATNHRTLKTAAAICLAGFTAALPSTLSAQAVPPANIVRSVSLGTINGNAGHIGANAFGDVFYVSQTDNVAYWLPRGKTTPISLVTGLSGGRSVYVDYKNNVYVSSNYSGRVIEVPYVNGTYATNTANSAGISTCTGSPTTPCLAFGNGAGATGYYLQAGDLGFDQLNNNGAGPDAYIVDERDNVCNQSSAATTCNTILKLVPTTNGAYTASVAVTNLPQTNNGQIAVGPNGDVYYCDGTYVYDIPAGATTYTTIGSGLISPTGVSTDVYGNLYITDSGSGANVIYEMPQLNGVAQASLQFIYLQTYSANGVAFDGLGHVFYTGYSGGTTLNQASVNTFNLGSASLGTPVAATAITLTVEFTSSATVGAITLSGTSNGFSYVAGSCLAGTAYVAGSSCNVNVNYKPNAVGLQPGAISLTSSAGANIATAALSGIGLGAAQTNDPGTSAAIGSGWLTPQGIAVDSARNVYVADPGQNAVLEYVAGASTAVKLGTGLLNPTSVALDTAGDVYIADSGNGRIVEVPSVAGVLTNSAQTVLATTFPSRNAQTGTLTNKKLGTALGIATDLNNNLYIADENNSALIKLGTVAGFPSTSAAIQIGLNPTTAASIFSGPIGVATDNTGDVFVADTTANTVTEITYYGSQVVNIGGSFSHPSGLAADASGSLYIADAGNGRLLKVPFESPIFNTNDQYQVGSSIATPYGVALDSTGNLYVADSADASVTQLNRLQGTLALGRANIGTSTSQSDGYVGNAGNQTLTLSNPAYVASGMASVFTITSPSTGGCVNSTSLAPSFACVLAATFSPVTTGNFAETLAFTSNAANTSTPSLMLTGVGLNQAPTTVSLMQTSPAGTASFGQAVVITAAIVSTKAGAPTGTVTFFVDGAQQPHPSTVTNGAATVTLTGLTGGKHTIGASYSGDNSFAPSAASTIMIAVAQAGSSVALATSGGYQNPPSAAPGTPVTLIATVTPGASTVPTGTVSFQLGATVLGKAAVGPVSVTVNGVTTTQYQANLTISTLPTAADLVVASYSGDINYTASSTSLTVTIQAPSFSVTPATATLTVTAGATGTLTLQVSSLSGYQGYVGITCSGLPANTVCGFSPNGFVIQPNNLITAVISNPANPSGPPLVPATYAPTSVVVSVITGITPGVAQPPVGELRIPGIDGKLPAGITFALLSPLALLLRRRARRRVRSAIQLLSLALLMIASAALFSGCGSNYFATAPKGTYQITINTSSTASSNPTSLAPGCVYTPSGSTTPTCTQVTQVSLVVQ